MARSMKLPIEDAPMQIRRRTTSVATQRNSSDGANNSIAPTDTPRLDSLAQHETSLIGGPQLTPR